MAGTKTGLVSGRLSSKQTRSRQRKETMRKTIEAMTADPLETPDPKQRGVSTTEYAVMLVLVALAVLAFGPGIANSVTNVFSSLASAL